MLTCTVGIVRRATRLDALVYQALAASDAARPWQRAESYGPRPPTQVSSALAAAWQALAEVRRWDAETLGHVRVVLRETVPGAEAPGDLPALGPELQAPPPPRATAAHPRAFRGTKYRPPRPRQPVAIDVRPYLLTRRHIHQVLGLLGEPCDAVASGAELDARFAPAFVELLLPMLRDCPPGGVGRFAAIAQALALHRDPALCAGLVGVYLAAGEPARAFGWWSHVLAHDAEQRCEVAQLVSASGVARREAVDPALAAAMADLAPVCRWSIYRALASGAAPAYVQSGLALGAIAEREVEHNPELPIGDRDVTAIVEATAARLPADPGVSDQRPSLWRLCGYYPELIPVLASPAFIALLPAGASRVIELVSATRWEESVAAGHWRALAPILPWLVEWLARVPAAGQRMAGAMMCQVFWWVMDHGHEVAGAMKACSGLAARAASPPLGTVNIGRLLPHLALWPHGEPRDRDAIRAAPEASWRAVVAACARGNQERLLHQGLAPLARFAPRLVAGSFVARPGALLATAELLAVVSTETAHAVMAAYAASPLADPAIADAPLAQLCALVEPIARAGGPNPVRRALRQHLAGQAALREPQLRGHRARIVEALDAVRLAAIRGAIDRELAARVGADRLATPAAQHAVAMLGRDRLHRRALRRLITACLAGDRTWRQRHTRSREWLARHPAVDIERWLAGVELSGVLDGVGPVRIAVETDPLEALRLGSHTGTCLGLGGILEYSAAATVLDINKQVVYARDAHGAVVARQLLAISEADQLVCYRIYGPAQARARPQIEPLFRDFDRTLAPEFDLLQTAKAHTLLVIPLEYAESRGVCRVTTRSAR